MKVSILLLTINRYHLTKEYVGKALKEAGHQFDLCITDNGSTEQNILQWNEQQNPKVYNNNTGNEGTAQSLNRMIEQNPSDYYVFIGNDIRLPENWLRSFVEYATAIPDSGVIGIDWRNSKVESQTRNGKAINVPTDSVFGTMFISSALRNKIGRFCEDYGPYGLWDGDYSIRAKKAGFVNYYLPNLTSHHFGSDVGENSDYRRMKDDSLKAGRDAYSKNLLKYEQGQVYI